jgi:hypothetical protein
MQDWQKILVAKNVKMPLLGFDIGHEFTRLSRQMRGKHTKGFATQMNACGF